MIATLRIQVSIGVRNAVSQLGALNRAIASVGATAAATSSGGISALVTGFNNATSHALNFGKNMQWVGRQLSMNLTLPLLAAGVAATKWALDNERAMTDVRKVYGAVGESQAMLDKELDALATSFELMSSRYGIAQAEVIDLAAAWAQAGSAGAGLAENTKATIEFMIISGMEAEAATKSLIGLQTAYRLNARDLASTLAVLNQIENETAVGMEDLATGLTKAAGAAKVVGVDARHVAAMLSALVPMTGSAASAGESLKTTFSRLFAPTRQAMDALHAIGIQTDSTSWQMKNGAERIEEVARATENLTDNQTALVTSVIGSRRQFSRFAQLMDDVRSGTGFYAKSLAITEDAEQNKLTYFKELQTYLDSNPQKFAILTNVIKNMMTSAIIPLLPTIAALLKKVAEAITWFSELPAPIRNTAVGLAFLAAMLGPVIVIGGTLVTFLAVLAKGLAYVGLGLVALKGPIAAVGGFLLSVLLLPFKLVLGAVTGLATALLWAAGHFMSFVGIISSVGTVLGHIGWMIGQLATMAYAAFPALQAIGAALIGLGTSIFTAVSGLLVTLYTVHVAPFVGMVVQAFGAMVARVMSFQIIPWVSSMVAAFSAMVSQIVVTQLLPFVQRVMFLFSMMTIRSLAVVVPFVQHMAGLFTLMLGRVGIAITALGTYVWQVLAGTILPSISTAMSMMVGVVVSAFQGMYVFTAALLSNLYTTVIAPFVGMVASAISTLVTTTVAPMLTMMWRAVATTMSSIAMVVWNGMLLVASTIAAWVAPILSAATAAAGAMLLPFIKFIAIAAVVVGAIYLIKEGFTRGADWIKNSFGDAINWLVDGLYKLPDVFKNMILGVMRVLRAGIEKVIELFSYLNPWARHSPSLVDNVTTGVDAILSEYARLSNVDGLVAGAAAAHQNFLNATGSKFTAFDWFKTAQNRQNVAEVAPNALPAFDAMSGYANAVRSAMRTLTPVIADQQRIVDGLEMSLKQVNRELDIQERILDGLEEKVRNYETAIRDANDRIASLADTGIVGMRAMSDRIFENEMAQKRLRLEMLKMEDVLGNIEDIRNQIAALNGDIENLRATHEELRQAGAGSEVLSAYEAEIAALEEQQELLKESVEPVNQMQAELEALQKQAERLELENSITFDPQLRQIQQLADGLNELPFDQIMASIIREQAEVQKLESQHAAANLELERQQEIVDGITARRDAINDRLTEERYILDILKDKYSALADVLSDMDTTIQDMVSGAKELADATSGSGSDDISEFQQNFDEAGLGSFDELEEGPLLGREGGLAEIEAFNAEMQAELERAMEDIGDFDLFAPIKDAWNTALNWLKERWTIVKDWLNEEFGITGESWGNMWETVKTTVLDVWNSIWNFLQPILTAIGDAIMTAFDFFMEHVYPVLKNIYDTIVRIFTDVMDWFEENDIFGDVWNLLSQLASEVWNVLTEVWETFQHIWSLVAPIVGAALAAVLWVIDATTTIIMWLWETFGETILDTLSAAWDGIYNIVSGVITVISNIIQFVLNIIQGDWDEAWENVKNILSGAWDIIKGVVFGAFGAVWKFITGILGDIIEKFTGWVSDIYNAGKDLIQGLWDGIREKWDGAWKWIEDHLNFVDLVKGWFGINSPSTVFKNIGIDIISGWWNGLTERWNSMWTWLSGRKDAFINAIGMGVNTLWHIGMNLILGLWNGIVERWNSMTSWVSNAAGSLTDTIKGVFGISSPSKVFQGIGHDLIDGLTLGILDKSKEPVRAAETLANSLAGVGFGLDIPDTIPQWMVDEVFAPGRTGYSSASPGVRDAYVPPREGSSNMTFNGDLVFPNVSDGDDAEEFIRNLKSLR